MDYEGPNPEKLWTAACNGDPGECAYLLERHHKIPGYIDWVHYHAGTTALVGALKYSGRFTSPHIHGFDHNDRHLRVVQLLLEKGAKIEYEDDPAAALHYAIQQGPSNEYMHLLLSSPQNIDVNQRFDGCTPIMTALNNLFCERRREGIHQVLMLLERGADVHTVDRQGNSLLHQYGSGDEELCNILKEYGVDFNQKGKWGRTPLHCLIYREANCIRHGGRTIVDKVKLFISHGANMYAEDDAGRTVVQVAENLLPPGNPVLQALRLRKLAFAMGTHSRNNDNCFVRGLPSDVIRMMESGIR
jgi:hypothetical protein